MGYRFSRTQLSGSVGAFALTIALASITPAHAIDLGTIDVWASRSSGIAGASTSVITAEDIARSPLTNVQDILSLEAGVQSQSFYGGVNGAGTSLSLRGFGITGSSNTLVLINGRRLTDVDLAGVDLSSIPAESIERIEISRGHAGAVLYGDGAVGGVINVVTKTGAGKAPTARVEGGFGSFNQVQGSASAAASSGPFSVSAFGTAINSDGYRLNNALRQRDGIVDMRWQTVEGSAYATLSADDQHLGLPGARLVSPGIDELATDRRGATTPTAFGDKKGLNFTAGVTRRFGNVEIIVDGGVRHKTQDAFTELLGFVSSDARTLTTYSFTPRAIIDGSILGTPSKITTGIDYYDASFDSNRSQNLNDTPYHRYDLTQRSFGAYIQQNLAITPSTDVSFGARLQSTMVSARDTFDPLAPGAFFFDAQATPLSKTDPQHALHAGIEHRFSPMLTVFGRVGRSFRTPTVDERVGVNAFPINFDLKTQTSFDAEAGFRSRIGAFEWQTSVYNMQLQNEILFVPFPPIGANVNLDPTRRFGVENIATWHVTRDVRLKGTLTYTDARFREGIFSGNQVPLVSEWTGNVGVSWNVWDRYLVLDGVVRFVGERRMDNDQRNFQPMMPSFTLVDLKVGGEIKNFFWSASVQNIFDVQYFDYAAASATVVGRYNAYPQPGRTFFVKAGATF